MKKKMEKTITDTDSDTKKMCYPSEMPTTLRPFLDMVLFRFSFLGSVLCMLSWFSCLGLILLVSVGSHFLVLVLFFGFGSPSLAFVVFPVVVILLFFGSASAFGESSFLFSKSPRGITTRHSTLYDNTKHPL